VGSFSLSVACSVVNSKGQKSKCQKLFWNTKEIQLLPQKKLDLVELLPRFELETSSLPILPSLFSLVAPCFVLVPGPVVAQRAQVIFCWGLMFLALRLRMGFFGIRMGFVWVFRKFAHSGVQTTKILI